MSELETTETSLTIRRTFDAPRERVFEAWTDPDQLKQWWGPREWTLPVCELDVREGGVWRYCMRGPNGEESWGKAVYQEIVEPERIVTTDVFTDEDGTPVDGMPEMHVTVEFAERDGATELTLTHEGIPADEVEPEQAGTGWSESFDKLDAHLSGDTGDDHARD